VRVNPQYLARVPPLVVLSVSAALTASLDTKPRERLAWLGVVLDQLSSVAGSGNPDADLREVAPKIMDVLSQRLQGAYMQIAERGGVARDEEVLGGIARVNRRVGEVRRLVGG